MTVRWNKTGRASAAFLTLLASSGVVYAAPPTPEPAGPTLEQKSLLVQMQDAFTRIAQTVSPAVVNIKAERLTPISSDLESPSGPRVPGVTPKISPPFTRPRTPRRAQATGSGVIVRGDGYILTNDHVVEGATNGLVTVTLSDGREYIGKVYPDFKSDLAVVKINPGTAPLPTAAFADSSQVKTGQWAIAVGSPFDLQNTVTVGIISALGRHQTISGDAPSGTPRYYPDLIQTDAAINPGNSGGPLFNIDGQVVGINVAIESPVEGSAGVGFAIPSLYAQQIMNALIRQGKVVRGYFGLAPDDLTPALQEMYGQKNGAFVRDVSLDSPAGKAGLQAGDIVTVFDGQTVQGENSLRNAISLTPPKKTVTITYIRDGQSHLATAMIGAAPDLNEPVAPTPALPFHAPTLGLTVRNLTAQDRQSAALPGGTNGVYITGFIPGSLAEVVGQSVNFSIEHAILQRIGKTPIVNKGDYDRATAALVPGVPITIIVLSSVDGQVHQSALTVRP